MTQQHYLVSRSLALQNLLEEAGNAPEYRLTETDQTDPAGRFRLLDSGDAFSLERALTAAWATSTKFLVVDGATSSVALGPTAAVVAGAAITLNGSSVNRAKTTSVGFDLHLPLAIFTDVGAQRTIAVGARVFMGRATISTSGNILTVTDASTLAIAAAPITDGVTVLTRAHALHVIAGRSYFGGNVQLTDNLLVQVGTDGDGVISHSSAGVGANTALASVLVGTVVSQAVAADSLLISNITASGDLAMYGNRGGNSEQFLFYDSSAGILYVAPGQFALTMSQAASTTNSVITLANTSNAAAASHAIVDIQVGGTTSTGDPQLRLTIPGGTSWYAGADNSASDAFIIGTGTAVGTSSLLTISTAGAITTVAGATLTLGNNGTLAFSGANDTFTAGGGGMTFTAGGAARLALNADTDGLVTVSSRTHLAQTVELRHLLVATRAITLIDTTTIATYRKVTIAADTYNGVAAGGAEVITLAIGLEVAAPVQGTNLTITDLLAARFMESIAVGNINYTAQPGSSIGVAGGVMLGADSTNNLFDDASNGAASTAMYIGNASINVTSDVRVKSNILDYQGDALNLLRRLPVKEFDYLEGSRPFGGGVYTGRYVGFTAQDLFQVAPWAVNTQGGKDCWECRAGLKCELHLPWQARYEFTNGLIVKAIQEQDGEVAEIKTQIANLEGRLRALERA